MEFLKKLITEARKKNFDVKEAIRQVKALKAPEALKQRAIKSIQKATFKIYTGVSTDGKRIQLDHKRRDKNLGTIETSTQIK